MNSLSLPALDCHAHIAPDVTAEQVHALGGTTIFAVTRSLSEAQFVAKRRDAGLVWGIGVHPGVSAARKAFDSDTFRRLLPKFALVGEVGLDARGGERPEQRRILTEVLQGCVDEPVLISVHSTGVAADVVEVIEQNPHPGLILHWFTGDDKTLRRANATGAYFSVNAAMSDEAISRLPKDRVLPETDFPARKVKARRPSDTAELERRLVDLWSMTAEQVRHTSWVNLRRLAFRAEALDRLPEALADFLLDI